MPIGEIDPNLPPIGGHWMFASVYTACLLVGTWALIARVNAAGDDIGVSDRPAVKGSYVANETWDVYSKWRVAHTVTKIGVAPRSFPKMPLAQRSEH